MSTPETYKMLLEIYNPYITANFEPVEQNESWTLLTRKRLADQLPAR